MKLPSRQPKLVTRYVAAEESKQRIRILLAEDNITNQKVALNILRKLGYRANTVGNGCEAVEALSSMPYDLVLMDCHMPEMDGFEASRAIRDSKTVLNRQVPIVALTADVVNGIRERCFVAGMTDYLSKPVDPEALGNMLNVYLAPAPQDKPVGQ